jgi:hypothetical protein
MSQRTAWCLLTVLAAGVPVAGVPAASAQVVRQQTATLDLPRVSPAAAVSQRVGLTDVEITYHRPAVNERTVWGGLVPYGQVWRTGANENTLISLSSDVTVEGQPLAAGTYGLHTIPGEEEWTIIFSRDTDAWGSFSYNEENDALRVTVQPGEVSFHQERMIFVFDEASNESAMVSLIWDKLQVPFKIEVDSPQVTLASIREQLKGVSQFFWMGPQQAANYCLQEEMNYEEAMGWIDASIQAEERFENLQTKAQLLEKTGDETQSAEIMAKALDMGNAGQLHNYARSLIGQDEKEEALTVFERNVKQNPDAWFVELGLARGYSALGQFDKAVASMKVSLERAPEGQKAYVQSLIDRLERKEDIN